MTVITLYSRLLKTILVFALERALHIHLMQNCDKIPPSEKRKLEFTELNHEKKAQLPKIGGTSGINHPMTMPQKPQQRISTIPKLGNY